MSKSEASALGSRKALNATFILYAVILLIFLLEETRGDFANGILFFIDAFWNVFVAPAIILSVLTFICGLRAGKEIIVERKNFLLTACKYAFIIASALDIYFTAAIKIKQGNSVAHYQQTTPEDNFTKELLKRWLILFIPLLASWLWATYAMRRAGAKTKT